MPVSSKRKLDEVEEEGTCLDQRKSILDISMTKLRCTPHRKVEPSLRRSVLIFNTLKHIENQLKLEGVTVPLPDAKPNLMPAMQTDTEDVIDTIPCSSVPYAQQDKCESMDLGSPCAVPCPASLSNNSVSCTSIPQDVNQPDTKTSNLMQPNISVSECGAGVHFNSTNSSHTSNSMDLISHECNKTELLSPDLHESNNYYQSEKTNWDIPPASTFTESLLSDTSKFILDSLLSSDKLVAVASFSSLFELESHETTSNQCANQNNNNNYSGSQIPPFTCLSNNSNYTLMPEGSVSTNHGQYQEAYNKSSQYQDLESVSSSQLSSFTSNAAHSSANIKAVTCRQQSDSPHSVGDIDCNSFDFDLFLPSLSPSMKLTQLNHDDLVHSLPSPDMSFSNQCTAGASLCNQKTELLSEDLDHIMQILVGI